MYFLSLPTVDVAIERVAFSVVQGGHHIPEDIIRRRFIAGRKNFEQKYSAIVNDWALYDNAGEEPLLIEWGRK